MRVCHEINIRVRFSEVGQMGIVHHSVYEEWFDMVELDFMRANGFDYKSLEESGYFFPQIEMHVYYKGVAFMDQELKISMGLKSAGTLKYTFEFEITDMNNNVITKGETSHILVDKNMHPLNVSKELPRLHKLLKSI